MNTGGMVWVEWEKCASDREWDGIPSSARHAGVVMASLSHPGTPMLVNASIAEIAEVMGRSRRVAQKAVKNLRASGWIVLVMDNTKARTPNVWALAVPEAPQ